MLKFNFRGFRDVIRYVKTASAQAIMRLFSARRSKYDDLLNRMSTFATVVQASAMEIDVSSGPERRTQRAKPGQKTIRTQQGVALLIDDFKAPNRQKLAKDVQMFEEADQYVEELDEMLVRLVKKKDTASRKFVKEMTTYRDRLIAQTEELHDSMDKIARNHLPKAMKSLMAELFKAVNNSLSADLYSELSQDVYVTSHGSLTSAKDKEPVEFTYYLHIEGLQAEAFKTDELILALTGVVREQRNAFSMTFHLTSLKRFTPPGSFDEGRQLTGANQRALATSLSREAEKLISLHAAMPMIGRHKINATTQQLRHSGLLDVDGVFDVSVDGDEIVIDIANMDNDVIRDDLWPEIIVYMRKVMRLPRKSTFSYKTEKKGANKRLRAVVIS